MTEPALLSAHQVSKKYRIRSQRSLALGFLPRYRPREHWALRALDLDVYPGEIVAVIGRNGAGKSTLLKLAAGVTTPTSGTVRRPDRIAPLIEVGAGFHPELSGRENVEVNARLLGVGAREIRRVFDEIVDFAQLAEFIDQPVRQYSSGMFMRLGFAVAIHTRPELLIVDEVLAVGDMPFQMRCLDRIRAMRRDGVGVLFVSHNLTAVQSLSDRGILLDHGTLLASGPTPEVLGAYHRLLSGSTENEHGTSLLADPRLRIESVKVTDDTGESPSLWQPGQAATVTLRVRAVADTPKAGLGFSLSKEGAGVVARFIGEDGPFIDPLRDGDEIDVEIRIALNVSDGGYLLDVSAGTLERELLLNDAAVHRFGVANRPGSSGLADVAPRVQVRRRA